MIIFNFEIFYANYFDYNTLLFKMHALFAPKDKIIFSDCDFSSLIVDNLEER